MEERNQRPEKSGSSPLDIAEYLALAGSVAGGVAVVAGKASVAAVSFAAPCLSLSLLLNFVNRRRMEQIMLQHSVMVQTHVQQLAAQANQPQLQPAIAAVDLGPIEQQLSNLRSQDDSLQQSVEGVVQQLLHLPTSDKLLQIETSLAQISETIAHLQANPSQVAEPASIDASQLHADMQATVAPLQTQLEHLQQQLQAVSTAPAAATTSDNETIGALQERLHQLDGRIETALASIAQLQQQPEAPSQPVITAENLAGLQSQLDHLNSRLEHVGGMPADVDLDAQVAQVVQQQFSRLTREMTFVDQGGSGVQPEELNQLEAQVAELRNHSEGALAGLYSQLTNLPNLVQETVTQHLSTVAQPAPSEPVEQVQQHLQRQVDALNARVDQALSSLQHEIGSIPVLVEQVIQAQDSKPKLQHSSSFDDLFPDPPASSSAAKADDAPDWDSLLAELDMDSK
jgi:chromosome segregation ATPase